MKSNDVTSCLLLSRTITGSNAFRCWVSGEAVCTPSLYELYIQNEFFTRKIRHICIAFCDSSINAARGISENWRGRNFLLTFVIVNSKYQGKILVTTTISKISKTLFSRSVRGLCIFDALSIIRIQPTQGWTAITRHGVKRKRRQRWKSYN